MQTNNKLREALAKILGIADHVQMRFAIPELANQEISELKQIAEAALAEPVRNCEVGTPKEQNERHNKFCYYHRSYEKCCGGCPLNGEPCCELSWAQMPYEGGGDK